MPSYLHPLFSGKLYTYSDSVGILWCCTAGLPWAVIVFNALTVLFLQIWCGECTHARARREKRVPSVSRVSLDELRKNKNRDCSPLFCNRPCHGFRPAILTSRQTREKLQCLYENLMSNNFRRTAVLKKISIVNLSFTPKDSTEKN